MKYTINLFGENHEFNSIEELEDFINDAHDDDPSSINEIGEITDEDGDQYGCAWNVKVVPI